MATSLNNGPSDAVTNRVQEESPWKKLRPADDPQTLAKQSKVMEAEKVVHSNYVPAQLERHLEFMQFNDDGHMILGCSNLTGRFWIGSLWYYRSPDEGPSVEKALTGVDFDNGLVDGFFINNKNIIVAGDNGGVEQVRLSFNCEEEPSASFFYLERLLSMQEHDDLISSICKSQDGSKIITCSYDRSIVVSETETFKLISRTTEAHTDVIYNIAVSDINPNVLTSAGNDGFVSLWDLRNLHQSNSSQKCIYDDVNLKPSCVQFLPGNENIILIGNQGGQIELFDIRKPKECVLKENSGDKSVTRIKFSPNNKKPNTLSFAVCYEDVPVRAFELDSEFTNIKQKYENKEHEDFVRDVLWNLDGANKFYSCGWDHKVIPHTF